MYIFTHISPLTLLQQSKMKSGSQRVLSTKVTLEAMF